MNIVLTRDPAKLGERKEWAAEADGLKNKGIGKTRAEALDSLVRANCEAFGISQWTEIDPLSPVPETHWATRHLDPEWITDQS
jgi:hypothetical protein